MGLRGAGHRFMPNRLVFPGGAVDMEDAEAPSADDLRPETAERLQRSGAAPLARAIALAAARELEEETGLHLGHPPRLANLDYLCRAITPPSQSIRFDARFLVVDAAHAHGELAGSGELEHLQWYDIEAALALDLALVTREVVGKLVEWIALSPAERVARTHTPVFSQMSWANE